MMATRVTEDAADWLWSSMDPRIVSELTKEQKWAIAGAAVRGRAENMPADVRLSFGRYFLVLVCGRERRNSERLRTERLSRPVFTRRNLPLLIGLWGSVIYTAYSAFGLVARTLLTVI